MLKKRTVVSYKAVWWRGKVVGVEKKLEEVGWGTCTGPSHPAPSLRVFTASQVEGRWRSLARNLQSNWVHFAASLLPA